MSKDSKKRVVKKANAVIERHGLMDTPVNFEKIAKVLGIGVFSKPLQVYDTELIGVLIPDQKLIYLGQEQDTKWQAFALALGLATFMNSYEKALEEPNNFCLLFKKEFDDLQDPLQKENMTFAMHLCIPSRLLIQYHNHSDQEVAEIFGVPLEIVLYRKYLEYA